MQKTEVLALCGFLSESRAENVVALDLRERNYWTDFFIICTVTSAVQLRGLNSRIKEYAADRGLAIRSGCGKSIADDEQWNSIDLGDAVVHLMTGTAREFYDLERLWLDAPRVYGGALDAGQDSL